MMSWVIFVLGVSLCGIQACVDWGNTPSVWNCDFEDGGSPLPCNLQQSTTDDLDWTLISGSTTSDNTGPDADHTYNNSTGNYIYLEASRVSEGEYAGVSTPQLSLDTSAPYCLTFWYHMNGEDIGNLTVMTSTPGSPSTIAWVRSAEQGNDWLCANVTIPGETTSVEFRASKGAPSDEPFGDIALDDVILYEAACQIDDVTTTSTATSTSTSTTTTTTTPPTTSTTTPSSTQPSTQSSTQPSTQPSTPSSTQPSTQSSTQSSSPSSTLSSTPSSTRSSTVTLPPSSTMSTGSTPRATTPDTDDQDEAQSLWGVGETTWTVILFLLGIAVVLMVALAVFLACYIQNSKSSGATPISSGYNSPGASNTLTPPSDKKVMTSYDNVAIEMDNSGPPTVQDDSFAQY